MTPPAQASSRLPTVSTQPIAAITADAAAAWPPQTEVRVATHRSEGSQAPQQGAVISQARARCGLV